MASIAVLLGLTTMVLWGLWAVFAKLATSSLEPPTALLISHATMLLVVVSYLGVSDPPMAVTRRGTAFATLAGVTAAGGGITLYAGLSRGDAAIVTTISAMYFVVAAVVGIVFLGDTVDVTDAAGILLAIFAIGLIMR